MRHFNGRRVEWRCPFRIFREDHRLQSFGARLAAAVDRCGRRDIVSILASILASIHVPIHVSIHDASHIHRTGTELQPSNCRSTLRLRGVFQRKKGIGHENNAEINRRHTCDGASSRRVFRQRSSSGSLWMCSGIPCLPGCRNRWGYLQGRILALPVRLSARKIGSADDPRRSSLLIPEFTPTISRTKVVVVRTHASSRIFLHLISDIASAC